MREKKGERNTHTDIYGHNGSSKKKGDEKKRKKKQFRMGTKNNRKDLLLFRESTVSLHSIWYEFDFRVVVVLLSFSRKRPKCIKGKKIWHEIEKERKKKQFNKMEILFAWKSLKSLTLIHLVSAIQCYWIYMVVAASSLLQLVHLLRLSWVLRCDIDKILHAEIHGDMFHQPFQKVLYMLHQHIDILFVEWRIRQHTADAYK